MINNKYVKFALIAVIIVISVLLVPYVLNLLLPFILAFVIAAVSQKMIRFLEHRLKIHRGISSAFVVLIIVFVVSGIATYIVYRFVSEILKILEVLPQAIEAFKLELERLGTQFADFSQKMPPEISEFLDSLLTGLQEASHGLIPAVTGGTFNIAKAVATSFPSILIFIIVFLMSTFFFVKDYDLATNFLKEILPDTWVKKLAYLRKTVFAAFFKYIKAQLIIMSVVFVVAVICLWIIGVENAIIAGFFAALFDALPIFGTGAVFVPWAVVSLIYSDVPRAIALLIIQFLCFLTRQMLEPKVLSKQIGIHPILVLISVFAGLKLFGFLGVIIMPVTMMLAVNFYVSYKESKVNEQTTSES